MKILIQYFENDQECHDAEVTGDAFAEVETWSKALEAITALRNGHTKVADGKPMQYVHLETETVERLYNFLVRTEDESYEAAINNLISFAEGKGV